MMMRQKTEGVVDVEVEGVVVWSNDGEAKADRLFIFLLSSRENLILLLRIRAKRLNAAFASDYWATWIA